VAATQPWVEALAREAGLGSRGLTVLPRPWKDRRELWASLDLLEDAHDHFARNLSQRLNLLHGTDFPIDFWEVLCNSWLQVFLHVIWDRHARLGKALEAFGPDRMVLAGIRLPLRPSRDFDHFVQDYAVDEALTLALYVHIADRLGIPVLEFVSGKTVPEARPLLGDLPLSAPPNGRPPSASPPRNALLVLASEWGHCPDLAVKELGASLFDPGEPVLDERPMNRSLLAGIPARNEFERIVAGLLPVLLPPLLVEGFTSLLELAEPFSRHAAYLTRYHWISGDPVFKAAAALGKIRGAKLIGWQHGGSYGHLLRCPTEWLERRTCDQFITWGWDDGPADSDKLLPLPQPHLASLTDTWRGEDGHALWVSTAIPRHTYRLQLYPADCGHHPLFLSERRDFLRSLEGVVRQGLRFRPYLWDFGWLEEEMALFRPYPEVEVLCSGNIPDILATTKLLVCDHIGTSMLYGMLMNAPTILFWNRDYAPERPSAEGHFENLRRAGVLFHDPQEAARQLNAVWEDPAAWWREPERQAVRREFVNAYCCPGRGGLEAWREGLEARSVISPSPDRVCRSR
jgi:hypothetical protein